MYDIVVRHVWTVPPQTPCLFDKLNVWIQVRATGPGNGRTLSHARDKAREDALRRNAEAKSFCGGSCGWSCSFPFLVVMRPRLDKENLLERTSVSARARPRLPMTSH